MDKKTVEASSFTTCNVGWESCNCVAWNYWQYCRLLKAAEKADGWLDNSLWALIIAVAGLIYM